MRDVLFWYFVNSALIEGIAAQDPAHGKQATFPKPMPLNASVAIFAACGIKPAVSIWIEVPQKPMIKR